MLANVERHNGFEVWRRFAEAINEDKAMVHRNLLASVTKPKGATSMDKIQSAVEECNTNIRLFVAANGKVPIEEAKRMTLDQMLPMEISACISMHEGLPDYRTFPALKRFIFKYVRTLSNLKRTGPRAAHLLLEKEDGPPPLETEEPGPDEEELMARLLASENVEEQVEILAFMR